MHRLLMEGLKLLLPLLLLFVILAWTISFLEGLFRPLALLFIPESYYFPGLGLLFGIAALLVMSILIQAWVIRNIYAALMGLIGKIPLLKTLYEWTGNFVKMATSTDPKERSTPVSVKLGQFQLMGFITEEEVKRWDKAIEGDELVAVYLPLSYQIGGCMLLVPRSCLTILTIRNEELLTTLLSAGLNRLQRPS